MRALLDAVAASTLRTLAVLIVLVGVVIAVAVSLFKLSVGGALALYFILWWTLLFAILPLRNQAEADPERIVPGQDPGAPAAPRLREKALWTTLFAAAAFLAGVAVFPLAGL